MNKNYERFSPARRISSEIKDQTETTKDVFNADKMAIEMTKKFGHGSRTNFFACYVTK